MRLTRYSAILAFTFISFTTASAQATQNNLVGYWKLISSVGKQSGTSFKVDSSMRNQIKVITPNKFVLTVYDPKSDSLLGTFQGVITVSGNTYTETIEKSSGGGMVGLTFKYTFAVNGNRWRIEGGGNGLELMEEWIKVD